LVVRSALAEEAAGVEIVAQNAGHADDPIAAPFCVDVENCIVELPVAVSRLRTEILLVAEA
jgi:hypothetical protein